MQNIIANDYNLRMAIHAAIAAGAEIMNVYNHPETNWEVEYKADNSPLTIADRRAHEAIVSVLAACEIPILSEEGAHAPYDSRKDWERMWVVDPLDGTKEFVKRNGEFTVNIALVENGTPTLSALYVPCTALLYYGKVGAGAWRVKIGADGNFAEEPQALPIPELSKSAVCTVVMSRSHNSPETLAYVEKLRERYGTVEAIQAGSSLKICRVAEGAALEYPRFGPTMEWDTAAGDAIVRASGGKMVHAETGLPLVYNKEDLHNPWFIVKRGE